MISTVVLVVATLAAAQAAPASLLYPVLPSAPHAYVIRPYAAASPVVHVPTSYSHVSHTQFTSHPVPVVPEATVYHTPLLYHAPAAVVV